MEKIELVEHNGVATIFQGRFDSAIPLIAESETIKRNVETIMGNQAKASRIIYAEIIQEFVRIAKSQS